MHNEGLIIIPTFNEVENLLYIYNRVRKVTKEDILFVDDGSIDGTVEKILDLAKSDPRVKMLLRNSKEGLGKAYQAAFHYAMQEDYDFIIHLDADGSHEVEKIPDLIRGYKSGFDLVVGSRYVKGGTVDNWSVVRRIISKVGNNYARFVLGLEIKDLTSGFRLYSLSKLQSAHLERATARGYAFQVQMTYLFNGFKILEVPIRFKDRTFGVSKMGYGIILEALVQIPSIRLKGKQ